MRLFVALHVPAEVRDSLAGEAAGLRHRLPAARWVPASNLHLTLRFLGETEPGLQPALEEALIDCFASRRPFRLELAEAGCFPPRRPARVAWVGFRPSGELEDLQAAVAGALAERLGIPGETRPFHPHLTLARPRRPWPRGAVEAWRQAFRGTRGVGFRVDAGHLMRSHLGPSGARHESLGVYPLAGRAGVGV